MKRGGTSSSACQGKINLPLIGDRNASLASYKLFVITLLCRLKFRSIVRFSLALRRCIERREIFYFNYCCWCRKKLMDTHKGEIYRLGFQDNYKTVILYCEIEFTGGFIIVKIQRFTLIFDILKYWNCYNFLKGSSYTVTNFKARFEDWNDLDFQNVSFILFQDM